MIESEGTRWIQAAAHDLQAAQTLLASGYYQFCAFHAQQAAEKALKGYLRLLGRIPWGHRCFDLLAQIGTLLPEDAIPAELFDSTQRLDGHYISSRYPDAFPIGVPADYYDEATAEQAVEDTITVIEFVERQTDGKQDPSSLSDRD